MERNNWSRSYKFYVVEMGIEQPFLRTRNNTRSLMINVNGNSIFNQRMTVIVQLNIKQTINHITCCRAKAVHKLWIRYFDTILEFAKLRSSALRRFFFNTLQYTHARRLSDTNPWISPNDERDWLLQSSATPISFTINLLYRVCALADDDGTREIGVWAWISIGGSRWQYPGQYEHRWCRMPTQRPTIDC